MTGQQKKGILRAICAIGLVIFAQGPLQATTVSPESLAALAHRLSRSVGHGGFSSPIRILKETQANGYANPDGSITLTEGLLLKLQATSSSPAELEGRLAAVLAHELGHIWNGHLARAPLAAGSDTASAETQKQEREADLLAAVALKRAGFSENVLADTLKLVARSQAANPYLSSHPSLNARLGLLGGQNQEHFQRLNRLEQAFGAIEAGGVDRLRPAVQVLAQELGREPGNPFLIQAQAQAYHGLWEASASIEELLFKTVLPVRYFDDTMLQKRPAVREPSRQIPGNLAYYRAARSHYQRLKLEGWIESAFLALQSYDPAARKEALARTGQCSRTGTRSSTQAQAQPTEPFLLANNYGIVFYQNGWKEKSADCFQAATAGLEGAIERMLKEKPYQAARLLTHEQNLQNTDPSNTGLYFAAFFNLGQFYHLTGNKARARQTWERYLKDYDQNSAWARYASLALKL